MFSEEGQVKIVADVHVVCTTESTEWLWGLANDHWADSVVRDMEKVCEFGRDNDIEELVTSHLEDKDLNQLGWEMTAVAVHVLAAVGAYRPQPDRGGPGVVFFLIKSIMHVN